jgi:hypothetical protein
MLAQIINIICSSSGGLKAVLGRFWISFLTFLNIKCAKCSKFELQKVHGIQTYNFSYGAEGMLPPGPEPQGGGGLMPLGG